MKKKILFFHYDLQGGGAERVLVNLLKFIDYTKYDVTLKTIFGAGPYVDAVPESVKFCSVFKREFRGFNQIMKILPGRFWHWLFIKGHYDIEVGFMENSPTRIIAACPYTDTKKVGLVHSAFDNRETPIAGFRDEKEMIDAYNHLDVLAFVAQRAQECFKCLFPEIKVPMKILHNVNDFTQIIELAKESIPFRLDDKCLNLCAVGRLILVKGFLRLIDAFHRLKTEGLIDDVRLYILGKGEERENLQRSIDSYGLSQNIKLLGFDPNPYKYLSNMDLFVCSSYREGYSTATTEAIALGIPVFTTDCSGMEEILENGKFGMIVPNDDESIYLGLKDLLTHRDKLSQYAANIKSFSNMTTKALVDEYEKFFDSL